MERLLNGKKEFKICIKATIDPAIPGLPPNLVEVLRTVENIITDTDAFYQGTTHLIMDILTEASAKMPQQVQSPVIGDFNKVEAMQTISMYAGSNWDNAITYKGVTKDVDEAS